MEFAALYVPSVRRRLPWLDAKCSRRAAAYLCDHLVRGSCVRRDPRRTVGVEDRWQAANTVTRVLAHLRVETDGDVLPDVGLAGHLAGVLGTWSCAHEPRIRALPLTWDGLGAAKDARGLSL